MAVAQSKAPAAAYSVASIEFDLLLMCASRIGDESAGPITVPTGITWDLLLRLAARHGLTTVLSRALRNSDLPADVRERLQRDERDSVQQSLRLTATLLEATACLNKHSIRCLAYKGPVLSQQLFGDVSQRESVDLDILVSPADVPSAVDALSAIGFQPARTYPHSARSQLVEYRAEFGMVRDGLLLELQWQLAPRYFCVPFDFEAAWPNRCSVRVADRTLMTLSPEDNLLALCVHGTKHQWEQLKWVLDIDLLLRSNARLDWEAVLAAAAQNGILRILLTSWQVAGSLLGTPWPPEIRQAMQRDKEPARIAAYFVQCLRDSRLIGENEHHRWMLTVRERTTDRGHYMTRLAYQPTESEWDAVELPPGLQWLYYPLRFARVVAKAVKSVLPG